MTNQIWQAPVFAWQFENKVFCQLANGQIVAYSYDCQFGPVPQINLWDWEQNPDNQAMLAEAKERPNLLDNLDIKACIQVYTINELNQPIREWESVINLPSLQHAVLYAWQCYRIKSWRYDYGHNWWIATLPIPFAPDSYLVAKGGYHGQN